MRHFQTDTLSLASEHGFVKRNRFPYSIFTDLWRADKGSVKNQAIRVPGFHDFTILRIQAAGAGGWGRAGPAAAWGSAGKAMGLGGLPYSMKMLTISS